MASIQDQGERSRIRRACLDLMYSQTRAAWVSNAFCIMLLWFAFRETASHSMMLMWIGIGVVVMALREAQSYRYKRLENQSIDVNAWTRWLEISLFANGCFWGISCAAFLLIATPYQLPIVLLIVGGLQTGSVLTSSYLLRAFALFSVPLFLAPLMVLLTLGFNTHTALLFTAALLSVWSMFTLMCASRFGKQYRRSVGYALENLDLAESLKSKNHENEALNESLHHRIDELNLTQRQLLAEKIRSDGLVRQLTELSTTDSLTGLGNRRSFDDNLLSECRRASRDGQTIALILADIDHFKHYNDHYGHLKGDDALVKVAKEFAVAARREGDWAARYGGEEFALILANTSLDTALGVAQTLRRGVVDRGIKHESSPTAPHVTLSLGVVGVLVDEHLEPRDLIAAADEALYEAKHGGRNRAVVREYRAVPGSPLRSDGSLSQTDAFRSPQA